MLKVVLVIFIASGYKGSTEFIQFETMEQCEEARQSLIKIMTEGQKDSESFGWELSWWTDYKGKEMFCVEVLR